jgi:putative ABC transport system permease protein
LGVIIGIAAIVCLLSIGQGLNVAVEDQFEKMGTNIVYLLATNPMSQSSNVIELSSEDVEYIESISGVDYAAPIYFTSGTMEVNGEKLNVSVLAMDVDKAMIFESSGFFDLREGRLIQKNESTGIMIQGKMADEAFSKPIGIRKVVTINNEPYKIVGLQNPMQQMVGDVNPENMVLMSEEGFDRIVPNKTPLQIMVAAFTREETKKVADKMTEYFDEKYGERSVYIYTSDQLLEQINQIYSIITIFLVGVSIIALIVGGVGIMNAMVTSVMEKTKEIGIMKALGASDYIILGIFVVEAALIGLIGGIIGTIIGYGLSMVIAFIGTQAGFLLIGVVSFDITLIGLGFSTIVGIVSGFFPAYRASKMDPVEALRFE